MLLFFPRKNLYIHYYKCEIKIYMSKYVISFSRTGPIGPLHNSTLQNAFFFFNIKSTEKHELSCYNYKTPTLLHTPKTSIKLEK